MWPRRCAVVVRVPEAELRTLQSQHLASLAGLHLETGPLRIVVHRFDCLASPEDVAQVARAMDAAAASCFDVLLSGVLFRPSPKKARTVVAHVKHGKKQLQAFRFKLAADFTLSRRFFFASVFVPVVELGTFTAIDPANMLEPAKQISFLTDVATFTAREVVLLDQTSDEVMHATRLKDKV